MEQNIIIQVGIVKTLSIIATLVVGVWYAAYRLGKIETKVVDLEITVSGVTGRVDKLYAGHSPVILLPKGAKILEESGLREWITENMTGLLTQCKTAMENPYDIQTAAFELFNSLAFPPKLEGKLKTCAFRSGVNMANVRRIGGIYFRDLCLNQCPLRGKRT